MNQTAIAAVLKKYRTELLNEWVQQQLATVDRRNNRLKESELRTQAAEFIDAFGNEVQAANVNDVISPGWAATRDALGSVSKTRAKLGFTTSETAMFVFSLKQPLLAALQKENGDDLKQLTSLLLETSTLLDRFGLYTTELYQKSREEVIIRQQQELLELSTPVVSLWSGILALPLIGTLDSARTQVVMENLLQEIVNSGATIAIIDITGVPTVDTLVAQHLLKTVAAARLMGADCIISGIRPQIAQTIVHLGVNLGDVTTKATLAAAFGSALRRTGQTVVSLKERD